MENNLFTMADAKALLGTEWRDGLSTRIVTDVVNVQICPYDRTTVTADIYWRHPQSHERVQPTPLKKFRAWMSKATQVK